MGRNYTRIYGTFIFLEIFSCIPLKLEKAYNRVNKEVFDVDEVFGELEYDAEYDAKSVTLETTPFQVSENTLVMMDEAVKNMKSGTVSEVIDLSVFGER